MFQNVPSVEIVQNHVPNFLDVDDRCQRGISDDLPMPVIGGLRHRGRHMLGLGLASERWLHFTTGSSSKLNPLPYFTLSADPLADSLPLTTAFAVPFSSASHRHRCFLGPARSIFSNRVFPSSNKTRSSDNFKNITGRLSPKLQQIRLWNFPTFPVSFFSSKASSSPPSGLTSHHDYRLPRIANCEGESHAGPAYDRYKTG